MFHNIKYIIAWPIFGWIFAHSCMEVTKDDLYVFLWNFVVIFLKLLREDLDVLITIVRCWCVDLNYSKVEGWWFNAKRYQSAWYEVATKYWICRIFMGRKLTPCNACRLYRSSTAYDRRRNVAHQVLSFELRSARWCSTCSSAVHGRVFQVFCLSITSHRSKSITQFYL